MPWFDGAPRPKTESMMDATRITARYDARRTRHHATALAGCLDRLAALWRARVGPGAHLRLAVEPAPDLVALRGDGGERAPARALRLGAAQSRPARPGRHRRDRKSTRLNSSHLVISYAVFCLKKKKKKKTNYNIHKKKKTK